VSNKVSQRCVTSRLKWDRLYKDHLFNAEADKELWKLVNISHWCADYRWCWRREWSTSAEKSSNLEKDPIEIYERQRTKETRRSAATGHNDANFVTENHSRTTYILKKFGQSTTGSMFLVKQIRIFSKQLTSSTRVVEEMFFQPAVMAISDIIKCGVGHRLSVRGIVVDKTAVTGPAWVRTDVELSSAEEKETVVLKFWNSNTEHVKSVEEGQLLSAYAMQMGRWHNKIDLSTTDQTVVKTHEMEQRHNIR